MRYTANSNGNASSAGNIIKKQHMVHVNINKNVERSGHGNTCDVKSWARILVQVTIYRKLLIGRDGPGTG